MCFLSFSSEDYFIKAKDLKELEKKSITNKQIDKIAKNCAVLYIDTTGIYLAKGDELLTSSSNDDFIKTSICYYTFLPLIGFFINLIKPIKRKFYIKNNQSFRVRFDKLLEANLLRGIRNRDNAYQWTNKRWQISKDEAKKRYEDLYNSIKANGYDPKSPMIVMINRKFGVKDQILQGHHRVGICQELDIKEVNICFWTTPCSFKLLNFFTKKGTK